MLKTLVFLRQTTIESFLTSGGALKECDHPYALTSNVFCLDTLLLQSKFSKVNSNPNVNVNASTNGGNSASLLAPALHSNFVSRKCVENLECSIAQLQSPAVSNRSGVSAIRFEPSCVLFAVAWANGVLQIYDFCECSSRIQRNDMSSILPVVTISTQKDISDLQWSEKEQDQLIVCFRNHSTIHVYDLNKPAQPKWILQVGKDMQGLSGHCVIKYVPLAWYNNNNNSNNNNNVLTQQVIVGTSNGNLRHWSFPGKKDRCTWEIRCDPNCARNAVIPVVAIEFSLNTGHVLAMNQVGTITIHDIVNHVVNSFSSAFSPKLLKRFSPFDSIPSTLNIKGAILVTGMIPNYNKGNGTEFFITTQQSLLFAFNIVDGTLTMSNHDSKHNSVVTVASRKRQLSSAADTVVDVTQLLEEEKNSRLRDAFHCPSIFPTWLGGELQCRGIHGTKQLQIQSIGNFLQPSQQQTAVTNEAERALGEKNDNLKYIKYQQTCLTLLGHITHAEKGSCDIEVSHNVENYLTRTSLATSSIRKSDKLVIEMASKTNFGDKEAEAEGVAEWSYSIDHIFGNKITLSAAYEGPDIVLGEPRTRLRTTLKQVCDSKILTNSNAPFTLFSKSWDMSSAVTMMEAHPSQPFIIVGCLDNTITILSCQHHNIDENDDNNDKGDVVVCTAESSETIAVITPTATTPTTPSGNGDSVMVVE